MPDTDIHSFIQTEEAYERGPGAELRQTEWEFALTGDEQTQKRVEELNRANKEHYSHAGRFEQLAEWRNQRHADPLLQRQVELLWPDYLGNQEDPAVRDRLVKLQADQMGHFNRFRAQLDGRDWSENDLNEALAETTDSAQAQRLWEAAKQVGREAEARAIEMVELNNRAARALGFRDAYARNLVLSEVDEARLFDLLDGLENSSDAPYRAEKAKLDATLAERFGVRVDALRPWHYGDPFFQRPPRASGPDLDPYFKDKDPEALALIAVDSIGLDARPILA